MNDREREVVALIDAGYTRQEIAEQLDVGNTSVKRTIKQLCEKYQCNMRELPRKIEKENDDDGHKESEQDV